VLLEELLVNGDCLYFCDAVLAESVCTVYYYIQLLAMPKLVAIQMSCVHSFIYMWCTFMNLDGTLVILVTGKMKLCLGVASQHKYVRLLCERIVTRIVHHSQLLCWQVCC
jgi:hypothetical protein